MSCFPLTTLSSLTLLMNEVLFTPKAMIITPRELVIYWNLPRLRIRWQLLSAENCSSQEMVPRLTLTTGFPPPLKSPSRARKGKRGPSFQKDNQLRFPRFPDLLESWSLEGKSVIPLLGTKRNPLPWPLTQTTKPPGLSYHHSCHMLLASGTSALVGTLKDLFGHILFFRATIQCGRCASWEILKGFRSF